MKKLLILHLSIAIASASLSHDQEWKAFKEKYNKKYSPREDLQRQKIFVENKLAISAHNKKFDDGKESFRMGINQFTDMLSNELNKFKGFNRKTIDKNFGQRVHRGQKDVAYPDTVDWRDSGCVSPVKNQGGECGSSWAFAVSGSLESVCCIKYGDAVALSTQNLVDCASYGCLGGFYDEGFQYCVDNGGLDTEESYPYTGVQGTCQFDPANAQCPCTGYVTIPAGSEDDLLAAVATVGPVAGAIDASQSSMQMYVSGIYYEPDCSSENVDHGILIVGYGTENEEDYWLVENWWGETWEEEGYIRMARNKANNCGIATEATYPLV